MVWSKSEPPDHFHQPCAIVSYIKVCMEKPVVFIALFANLLIYIFIYLLYLSIQSCQSKRHNLACTRCFPTQQKTKKTTHKNNTCTQITRSKVYEQN